MQQGGPPWAEDTGGKRGFRGRWAAQEKTTGEEKGGKMTWRSRIMSNRERSSAVVAAAMAGLMVMAMYLKAPGSSDVQNLDPLLRTATPSNLLLASMLCQMKRLTGIPSLSSPLACDRENQPNRSSTDTTTPFAALELLPFLSVKMMRQHWNKGWGSGPHLEQFIRTMHSLAPHKPTTVIDIGAAAYSATGGDISHAFLACELWKERATVVGFEPGPVPFANLQAKLAEVKASTGANVRFEQKAVSTKTGTQAWYDSLKGFDSAHNIHGLEPHGNKIGEVETVTLSDYVKTQYIDHIDFLKIDVEGHEVKVIESAVPLLEKGLVDVLTFEYGDKWSMETREAMYHGKDYDLATLEPEEPALSTAIKLLEGNGMDVFYIGEKSLVPVSGPFWTPMLQICLKPKLYGLKNGGGDGDNCWLDLLAIRRSWAGRERLIDAWMAE